MAIKRKSGPPPRQRVPAEDKRARFIAEYLIDSNATQAAIRAGYSAKCAYAQGHRLLKVAHIRAAIEAHQQKVQDKLHDRYEITADRIKRELAMLGYSNMLDYGSVRSDGTFDVDLSETDRDQAAAIQSIKTKRSTRYYGETQVDEVTTELRLAPKREALVEMGKIVGLFKDGIDVGIPVTFIVQRTGRSKDAA